jgi:osmotically-inducible protein OsmY
VAKTAAPNRVIANEISIQPVGVESQAKEISKNVDEAIEKNFKAALVANNLDKQHIRFGSKNGVLTLKGSVETPDDRQSAQQIATTVPNVQQVINELQVKGKNRGGV